MASVYRKQVTKPLPQGAELFTRKGEQFARWKDRKGKSRTAPVRVGRDGSQRIVIQAATFTAKYRDGSGVVREVATGCQSKDGALTVLRDLASRAEKVRANIITAQDAATADHQHIPLPRHIDDYLNQLEASDTSADHRANVRRCLTRLSRECRFSILSDLHRESLEKWLVQAKRADVGARTRNLHQASLVAFCNWCVRTGRLPTNPFALMSKADEKSDRRRHRRALTEGELGRLLYVARWRPLAEYGRLTERKDRSAVRRTRDTWRAKPLGFYDLDAAVERARERLSQNPEFVAKLEARGRQRALVYKTLVLTGLRRGELASLTVGQIELDGPVPFIVLHAADDKSREGSEIPIRRDLANDLTQWLAERAASLQEPMAGRNGARLSLAGRRASLQLSTRLFQVPRSLINALNRDLVVAGISKVDSRGRSIDVHALRHTFGTLLSRNGVAPRTAQAAMRHSDIDLTMNVYTDPKLLDVAGAIETLPELGLGDKPKDDATQEPG